jgi:hypothetical protein
MAPIKTEYFISKTYVDTSELYCSIRGMEFKLGNQDNDSRGRNALTANESC